MKILQHYLAAIMLIVTGACQHPNQGQTTAEQSDSSAMERLDKQEKRPIVFERHRIAHQKDTLTFELAQPAMVHIDLKTSSTTGNIRLNQLLMPNGQADGPFGKNFADSLTQVGTYRLIISESLMQENPYTGDYQVKIELK